MMCSARAVDPVVVVADDPVRVVVSWVAIEVKPR
jgi:hypothetical protein